MSNINIPVKVTDGRGAVYAKRRSLKSKYGLKYNNGVCSGNISSRFKYHFLFSYCKRNGLKLEINNEYGKRSTTYRKEFFTHNTPLFKDYYFCAYCGKLLSRKKITIDHLYPVYKVNSSPYLQEKLARKGAKSVNSYQNLVPSCMKCNLQKGTDMGIWIFKGLIGRSNVLCIFRWIARITVYIFIIFIIYKYASGIFGPTNVEPILQSL